MRYILDTNIVLLYLRHEPFMDYIESQFDPFGQGNQPSISIVTIGEIRSITKRNKWGEKRKKAIGAFMDELIVLDIHYQDILNAYAEIDAFSQGKIEEKPLPMTARNMGKNDLWIAASAYVTNSKLITTDKDFNHLNKEYFDVLYIDRNQALKV